MHWIRHDTGTHHVAFDVDHAAGKVVVAIDGGGMVTVLPERAAPLLALVVLLAGPAGDQLRAFGDFAITAVFDQQMDVIESGHVVEHAQVETLVGLKQPATPVTDEFQQKLTSMAAVFEMPDLARNEMTISARYDAFVKGRFWIFSTSNPIYWENRRHFRVKLDTCIGPTLVGVLTTSGRTARRGGDATRPGISDFHVSQIEPEAAC